MINVSVKLNKGDFFNKENIDHALRRFKNKVDQEEILEVIKKKRAFETPKQIKIRKTKRLHRKMKEARNSR